LESGGGEFGRVVEVSRLKEVKAEEHNALKKIFGDKKEQKKKKKKECKKIKASHVFVIEYCHAYLSS
jgi:adenosine/AMP kinase